MSARATRVVAPRRHFAGRPLKIDSEDSDSDSQYESEDQEESKTKEKTEATDFNLIALPSRSKAEAADLKSSSIGEYEEYEIEEAGIDEEELKKLGIVVQDYESLKLQTSQSIHENAPAVSNRCKSPEKSTRYKPLDTNTAPEYKADTQDSSSSASPEQSSSSQSESETDSEEEPVLARPIFIKRNEAKDKNVVLKEPSDSSEEKRVGRTLDMIQQAVRKEQADERTKYEHDGKDLDDIDDTDDVDPEAELQAWKQRELGRLRRERQMYLDEEREQEELERRRNLSEEQILEEDRAKLEQHKKQQHNKSKGGFMQRYYHRGAFYQQDEILKRNFSEVTEDDYKDKSALPKIMQVREGLGLKGRTRHRTLREEDTTLQDDILRKRTKR